MTEADCRLLPDELLDEVMRQEHPEYYAGEDLRPGGPPPPGGAGKTERIMRLWKNAQTKLAARRR